MIPLNIGALKKFIQQKRSTKEEKIFWASQIISLSENIVAQSGRAVHTEDNRDYFEWRSNEFSIVYSTPFSNCIENCNCYTIDIWIQYKKVFSARWEPLDIIRFDRGGWMIKLFFSLKGETFYVR